MQYHVQNAVLVDMALQPALQLLHVLQHVLLDTIVLLDRLTHTEELLQADLDLVLIYALQDTAVLLVVVLYQ